MTQQMTFNLATLAILLLALALQACGGNEGVEGDGRRPDGSAGGDRAQAARGIPEALFAQDGRPSRVARQPPPGLALRTAAGLYATTAQFEWEALTVEPYTVLVDVDQHATAAVAIEKTLADFRWSLDGARAAHYVRAAELPRALAVADALTAAGLPLVFLVVDGALS